MPKRRRVSRRLASAPRNRGANSVSESSDQMGIDPQLARPAGAPPLYAQDGKGLEAIVHAHYFVGGCDWLVTEYDPADDLAFGWACLNGDRQNAELGYVSLAELEEIRVPLQLQSGDRQVRIGDSLVERDSDWPEGLTIRQGIETLDQRQGLS
jgi:hypothetical protein